MRKTTFVIVWALAVACSLAMQHFWLLQPVDAWSAVLAIVAAGVTLAAMEWLRREATQARAERARLLAELRTVRELQEGAIGGASLRVIGAEGSAPVFSPPEPVGFDVLGCPVFPKRSVVPAEQSSLSQSADEAAKP